MASEKKAPKTKLYRSPDRLWALVFYVLITLLYFPQFTTKIFITLGDNYVSYYSGCVFFREWIQKGIYPLWNPLSLCGIPYFTEVVNTNSLWRFLLFWIDTNASWNFQILVNRILSGWIFYLLLRKEFKLCALPAFAGGAMYMFLGNLSMAQNAFGIATFFLPLTFLTACAWIRNPGFKMSFLWALTLDGYYLNSHPQHVFYFCLFLGLFVYLKRAEWMDRPSWKRRLETILLLTVPVAMTGLLLSFQIFPMLEQMPLASRTSHTYVTCFSPTFWIDLFHRSFFLTSLRPDLNFFFGRMAHAGWLFLGISPDRFDFGAGPYTGAVPFLLAVLFFFKKHSTPFEKFLKLVPVIILAYILLNPFLYRWIAFVPIIGKMPNLRTLYEVYYFCIPFLAALSLQSLFYAPWDETFNDAAVRKFLKRLAALVIVLSALRLILWSVSWLFDPTRTDLVKTQLLPIIKHQSFFKANEDFYLGRLKQLFEFTSSWAHPANFHFWFPVTVLILFIAGTLLYLRRLCRPVLYGLFLSLLIACDLYAHFQIPSFSPEDLRYYSAEAAYLNRQKGIFRVMPLQQDSDSKNPPLVDERPNDNRLIILQPMTNMIYGLSTPEGYANLTPDRQGEFMDYFISRPKASTVIGGDYEAIDSRIANLLNIRFFVTPKMKRMPATYPRVWETRHCALYENPGVYPRAFMVHRIRRVQDSGSILKILGDPGFDLRNEMVLEGQVQADQTFGAPSESDHVEFMSYTPNEILIKVQAASDGYLLLTDSVHPNWRAQLDEKSVPIETADYLFRAVFIPQGEHRLRFFYSSRALEKGLAVSAVTFWGGWILILILFLSRKFHHRRHS